jgi:transposase-like protein
VQKLLPDIIALRDQEAGVEPIARILGISEISVKAVIKRYPATLGRSAEQKMTDKIVKAYATGQQPTEIAKALGISVSGVKHRLRQAQKPLERTPRKVAAPPWLKAVQKRRSVELGDGVTADKGVPPEVIVALDALLAERPKSGVKPLARDKNSRNRCANWSGVGTRPNRQAAWHRGEYCLSSARSAAAAHAVERWAASERSYDLLRTRTCLDLVGAVLFLASDESRWITAAR